MKKHLEVVSVLCYNENHGKGKYKIHRYIRKENKMKKLLGISLIAILAASPFAANAEVTPNNKIATTSYVQGAYEAAVDAATDITGDLSNLATSFTDGDRANLVAAVNATKTIADSASAQAGSGAIEVVTGTHDEGEGEDVHSVNDYAENLTEAVNQLNTNINGLQDGVNGAATITKLGAGASGYDIGHSDSGSSEHFSNSVSKTGFKFWHLWGSQSKYFWIALGY